MQKKGTDDFITEYLQSGTDMPALSVQKSSSDAENNSADSAQSIFHQLSSCEGVNIVIPKGFRDH